MATSPFQAEGVGQTILLWWGGRDIANGRMASCPLFAPAMDFGPLSAANGINWCTTQGTQVVGASGMGAGKRWQVFHGWAKLWNS